MMRTIHDLSERVLAKLLFTSRHHSRRSAKRYLRQQDLPGRADVLDDALAWIEQHPQRLAIDEQAEALRAAELAAAQAIADMAEADAEARRAEIIGCAKAGNWLAVMTLAADTIDMQCCFQDEAEALRAILENAPVTDADRAAAIADDEWHQGNYDGEVDAGNDPHDWAVIIAAALEKDACALAAERDLRSRMSKDGRYRVIESYRKTLSINSDVGFDDRDDAVAWCRLSGDYSTSSYRIDIIDSQEANHA